MAASMASVCGIAPPEAVCALSRNGRSPQLGIVGLLPTNYRKESHSGLAVPEQLSWGGDARFLGLVSRVKEGYSFVRSQSICFATAEDVEAEKQIIKDVDISLQSVEGISFQVLRDKLAAGEWEAADGETRRLLCELAGEGAVKRKWVYFSEVQFIAESDLRIVDSLWRAYSSNKFGYSVQAKIWNKVNRNWNAYFKKVGWTRALDERQDIYRKFPLEFTWDVADPTPEGHLPLTNALRGTQLLEKLFCHPAFADVNQQQKLQQDPGVLSNLLGGSLKSR